jgi:polysaccharide biosynthesis protein PelG
MAGIGFELRKLFNEQGLISSVKAYAFSSITTIGPMVLCMVMIVGMQWMMVDANTSYSERELFLATVVYAFIFSVLITGGISMLLTRFIADMMYLQKLEHLMSSFYGAVSICLPIGMVSAWTFMYRIPVSFEFKLASYFLFAELIIIWIQAVHLSALKDYKRIVRNFAIGICLAMGLAWFMLYHTPYASATAVIAALDIGFFVIVMMCAIHFEQRFPNKSSRIYFDFISYFRKFPSLFLIGTFLYAGVYIHSFVYWLGPHGRLVAEQFAISPFYDLPVFYAYLTVVPTLVTFVVSVETVFYEKFRHYYDRILNGGTFKEIEIAKKDMQRTLVQEISFLMEVQLLFTILSIAIGVKVLPAIGFTMEQLETFNILVLGYYLFIIAFIIMLLLLYFDDRKGVLMISGLYVVLNTLFSYWTMIEGFDGLGMFIASFLILTIALIRLVLYVRNIDYYTFCSQPITVKVKKPIWQRWRRRSAVSTTLLLACVLFVTACTSGGNGDPITTVGEPAPSPVNTPVTQDKLLEDKRLYERDQDGSIMALYLTVLPDMPRDDDSVDWYELNRIERGMQEGELKVIVQEGAVDGSGPKNGMFGFGDAEANGEISLRGNSTRYASQRSYKIKLNDQAGLWRDQRVLNLNKHPFDASRIRNKLSFDLIETLPAMTSLRTQFVKLFVKDLSSSDSSGSFVDYGLYTHVENPNELFLKNHWLDPYGQLYKAEFFEFHRYPEAIKMQSDPTYDKEAFEAYLEIQGREDHEKVIAMLDDVNNIAIPIDEVMAKHFDLDNYLTWLAVNILMDNMDTGAHNFLLYSPLNSNKWYFLPWDYDGAWEKVRREEGVFNYNQDGLSTYWGSVLHNRFFRSEKNVRLLKDKVDELYASTINNESISKQLEQYRAVMPVIQSSPDARYLPIEIHELEAEWQKVASVPLRSLQRFQDNIEKPMPFFLGDPINLQTKQMQFTWDPAYDLQGEDLVYDWILARDPRFNKVVHKRSNLRETKLIVDSLAPGTYYWMVRARDTSGNEQVAFDIYRDEEGIRHYGVREMKVGE